MPFDSERAFDDARRMDWDEYRPVLGGQYSDVLAHATAICECLQFESGPRPWFVPLGRLALELFHDEQEHRRAGAILQQLVTLGYIRRVSNGDATTRTCSLYEFPAVLKTMVRSEEVR